MKKKKLWAKIGGCINDKRYSHNARKRGHIGIMKWHCFTSDPAKPEQWIKLIGKGSENFQPGKWTYVCSNHFISDLKQRRQDHTMTRDFLKSTGTTTSYVPLFCLH